MNYYVNRLQSKPNTFLTPLTEKNRSEFLFCYLYSQKVKIPWKYTENYENPKNDIL